MKGVKTFIELHVEEYPDLEVDYQKGHKPVLILFDDDGNELERTDFTREMSVVDVQHILEEKGLFSSGTKTQEQEL